MRLSKAAPGEYAVLSVMWGQGGRESDRGEKIRHRLAVLGIYPGARIQLTEIAAGDVRILSARGMRLALGRQVAARITVTPR